MVLEAGYARGADLWYLATAHYMAADLAEVTFVTWINSNVELR